MAVSREMNDIGARFAMGARTYAEECDGRRHLAIQNERLDGGSNTLSEALVLSIRAERNVKSNLR